VADLVGSEKSVAKAFREEWGKIVAYLIGITNSWDLAEDCAQYAFERALQRWPKDGVPNSAEAWLKTTARNRAFDLLRREALGYKKIKDIEMLQNSDVHWEHDDSGIGDDRLRLMFTCCHPALAIESQVALTLRTLAGLTTPEIARAFLVSPETMAKRLTRAKQKIAEARIPYRVPPAHSLGERLAAVLAVIYALFNEGYSASHGDDLVRTDLCSEAIRLGRILTKLMPDEPEALGAMSLMLLQDSRKTARLSVQGEIVTLDEQDRRLWDIAAISEACQLLDRAMRLRRSGPYQLQAAIAACHATASTPEETDWHEIAVLYQRLSEMVPTPVVRLNQAVAVAMADGPESGLALVDALYENGELANYYLLPATRADLLMRLSRHGEAAIAYQQALELAPTDTERRFLRRNQEISHTRN
jgi:RNA polymerase sigma-70 factor (ECF subfamily)